MSEANTNFGWPFNFAFRFATCLCDLNYNYVRVQLVLLGIAHPWRVVAYVSAAVLDRTKAQKLGRVINLSMVTGAWPSMSDVMHNMSSKFEK